jgi:hypothetical protein
MTSLKKLTALLGAGALVFAMAGTALGGGVEYATVSGHAASTSDNNSPDFWGEDCTKFNAGEGDLGSGVDSYVLSSDYTKVIVKAGSTNQGDPNGLTIFDNPTAGQTVWADTNGDNVFNPGGQGGDKNISHIIFCGPSETTTTTTTTTTDVVTTTTTDTFTSDTGGETDAPSEPNTATIGGTNTGAPADGAWLLVIALGVLLASIVVLTPAKARVELLLQLLA